LNFPPKNSCSRKPQKFLKPNASSQPGLDILIVMKEIEKGRSRFVSDESKKYDQGYIQYIRKFTDKF
jgi:hypothetical protein